MSRGKIAMGRTAYSSASVSEEPGPYSAHGERGRPRDAGGRERTRSRDERGCYSSRRSCQPFGGPRRRLVLYGFAPMGASGRRRPCCSREGTFGAVRLGVAGGGGTRTSDPEKSNDA